MLKELDWNIVGWLGFFLLLFGYLTIDVIVVGVVEVKVERIKAEKLAICSGLETIELKSFCFENIENIENIKSK